MTERGERADGRVERGVAIDERRRGADRVTFLLAGERHQAAHRLAQRIERGALGVRAVLTEA